jgi:hypothetical protein
MPLVLHLCLFLRERCSPPRETEANLPTVREDIRARMAIHDSRFDVPLDVGESPSFPGHPALRKVMVYALGSCVLHL